MDVLGVRADYLLGEAAEGGGDHLHLVVEVQRSGLLGQRGHELGGAKLLEERMRRLQRRDLDPPRGFAAGDAGDQVVHHVGGEGAGDLGLGASLGAVVEQGACRLHLCGSVCQIVGEHLANVGPTVGRQVADPLADDVAGQFDDVGGTGKIGHSNIVGHSDTGAHGREG